MQLSSNMRTIATLCVCVFLYCGKTSVQAQSPTDDPLTEAVAEVPIEIPTEVRTGLSREEKQGALDLHNDLRRREGASDMLLMVLHCS